MTQAFNLAQLANNLNTSGQLDATDGLFGALPIANGGTGQATAANAINALLPTQTNNKVSATSDLYFHVGMPTNGNTNSGMYVGIGIDGSYNFTGYGLTDVAGEGFFVMLQKRSGISSGNRTITLNQIPVDGSANRTVDVVNPNSADDARNQQMGTNFIVYEIEP